ncbi:Uncharacterised protein [Mycobacteroides abscessus subsp. abscessus]|nr:Uncharacterised protein [Mycobacteroides abscessus subsp. abscessus]
MMLPDGAPAPRSLIVPAATRMPAPKIMAMNAYNEILPPPVRSDSQPPNGRASEPSKGPMNAI